MLKAPCVVITEFRRQQHLDSTPKQELTGEEEGAVVGTVRTRVCELWQPTLMDDDVSRLTERHEPMLQVRNECGLGLTILIFPGSSVNRLLLRRPHQDLGILLCRVWQRLKDFSEFAGALPGFTRSC